MPTYFLGYRKKKSHHPPAQLMFDFPVQPDCRIDNFVVCQENELAYNAAVTLAAAPLNPEFNPLVFVGDGGAGKTHLIHAIARKVEADYPNHKIAILSTADLIGEETEPSELSDIFKKFNDLDLLLIDDIHLIEGHDSLQEGVFHLYNQLLANNRPVVFTSRVSPTNLKGIEGYLSSRLLSGAIVSIKDSEDNIRISILKKIARDRNVTLSDNAAQFIINHHSRDIDRFEEIIDKISAYAGSLKMRITPPLIKKALGDN
ncbi:MAG: DnaA/Hda family protein [Nitrospinota bacterium]